MQFVIASYGDAYVPFLSVCLDSLQKTHPDDLVTVVWDQISDSEIQLLHQYFSSVDFQYTPSNITENNIHARISLKLRLWTNICRQSQEEFICFLDSDMLVYQNITDYLNTTFDFLYTWKDEKYPLNVGIVIVRNSPKIIQFLEKWLEKVERIVHDTEMLENALETHGAADQRALADLMELSSFEQGGQKTFKFGTIHFKGVPCSELNQTNSVPVNCGSKIFHYKGGWRPILLEKSGYSDNRPRETSMEMRAFWENRYADFNETLLKDFVTHAASKYINIIDWENILYEERGILHSEMLVVLAVIKELGIELVIESGRARGQSTFILAKTLSDSIPIISLELLKDDSAEFAEKRLKKFSNVDLLYGDTYQELPKILERFPDKKIAILLDGPKGEQAYQIVSQAIEKNSNIVAAFFHDCRKSYRKMINPSREAIHKYYDRIFFTDDKQYLAIAKHLDKPCAPPSEKEITFDSWRPYFKGFDPIGSYGPTLAVVLPNIRDRQRWEHLQPRKSSSNKLRQKPSVVSRIVGKTKAFLFR